MNWLLDKLGRLTRGMALVGAALVWPFEWAAHFFSRLLFSASEGLERVDSVFVLLYQVVSWPFRVVWRALAWLAGLLLPDSVRERLSAALDRLGSGVRGLGATAARVAEFFNIDWLFVWLVWLLQPVWRPIGAIVGFVSAWWVTREWRQALWGLPAIIMLLPILLVVGLSSIRGNGRAVTQYKLAVKEALEANDYDRVQLFERKLAQLGADTQRTDYRTAVALAEEDKLDQAYERMQRLAPIDQPGYAAAHFWIIQQLVTKNLELPADEMRRLVGVHLDHLQTLGHEGPQVMLLRALWLAESNRLAEAADVLGPLAEQVPDAAIERMRIHLALRDRDAAREDAEAVSTHMQEKARRSAEFNSREYQWWAVAEELLENGVKLRAVLEDWREVDPEDARPRESLAGLYRAELQQLMGIRNADGRRMAELLLDVAELASDPRVALGAAGELARQQSDSAAARRAVEILAESPRTTVALLDALGTSSALAGNWHQAIVLLVRAMEKDPDSATVWNNYAWTLANRDEPDLETALTAVNRALEIAPDEYRFRETRGQILVKLERWEEALSDLEFAVNGLPELAEIHLSMAAAYEALGQSELARIHREAGE